MISQDIKDVYFLAARWLAFPNHVFTRIRQSMGSRSKPIFLHLGCGDTYIPGMLNVDGNIRRKKELWLDLRNGLPFADRSVSLIYCSHMIEHLYPRDAIALLREMQRVLKKGECARVAVPSIEYAIAIANGQHSSIWPQRFEGSLAQAVNYLFCDGQHKYGYSSEILTNFAKQAGFSEIRDISQTEGVQLKQYYNLQLGDEPVGSLVFELVA